MQAQLNHPRSERGQSLTEMGLSMVILLILLGGGVDRGPPLFPLMVLANSVQEGAMYGSINPTLTQEIKNHVLNSSEMIPDLITNDDITVELIGAACTGNSIRVMAVYPDFPVTMPLLGTILGRQTVSISASVIDTILSPACP